MPGPLAGVKIVELATMITAPMATKYLADQGAEVIKVEPPIVGDTMRHLGPKYKEVCSFYAAVNRNKRSIAVDVKSEKGRDLVKELVKDTDVFIQNFRPGAIQRLGLSYEDLKQVNPDLIYISISGFGQDGPYADRRVYDNVIQLHAGFAATQADPATGEPQVVRNLVCDKLTAAQASQAITAALFAKAKNNAPGQHIDLCMLDAALEFIWPDGMWNNLLLDNDEPPGPNFGDFYQMQKGRDGFMMVGAVTDDEFRAVARGIGRADIIDDPRFATAVDRFQNAMALKEILEAEYQKRPVRDLVDALATEGAPAGVFNSRDEVPNDPQVKHNGSIIQYDHPVAGRIQEPRHAPIFSETPAENRRHAPMLGEQTDEILTECGHSPADIAALRESGVVA